MDIIENTDDYRNEGPLKETSNALNILASSWINRDLPIVLSRINESTLDHTNKDHCTLVNALLLGLQTQQPKNPAIAILSDFLTQNTAVTPKDAISFEDKIDQQITKEKQRISQVTALVLKNLSNSFGATTYTIENQYSSLASVDRKTPVIQHAEFRDNFTPETQRINQQAARLFQQHGMYISAIGVLEDGHVQYKVRSYQLDHLENQKDTEESPILVETEDEPGFSTYDSNNSTPQFIHPQPPIRLQSPAHTSSPNQNDRNNSSSNTVVTNIKGSVFGDARIGYIGE